MQLRLPRVPVTVGWIELIATFSVLAVVVMVLLLALRGCGDDSARLRACANNMRLIGQAFHRYVSESDQGYAEVMLPLDEAAVRGGEAFVADSAENCARQIFLLRRAGLAATPEVFHCPLDESTTEPWTAKTKLTDPDLRKGTSYNLSTRLSRFDRFRKVIAADQPSGKGPWSANHGDEGEPGETGWTMLFLDGAVRRSKTNVVAESVDTDGIYTGTPDSEGNDTYIPPD